MPPYLEWEAKHIKNEQSAFHKKGDITDSNVEGQKACAKDKPNP
jgi:hypothetical protein